MDELRLECLSIGSLPYIELEKVDKIYQKFSIPFWTQFVNKNEVITTQFLEGMPSFFYDKNYLDTDYDNFKKDVANFLNDYKTIIQNPTSNRIEKYGMTSKRAFAFDLFLKQVKKTKPKFAKTQVAGAFTVSSALKDQDGNYLIFDKKLREIITKTLTIKALWQIKKIKEVSPDTTPIIFIDEPLLPQLGTPSYFGITTDETIDMLKNIVDVIKNFGGIVGLHCCGECDWTIPIRIGADIINPDFFSNSQNFLKYSREISQFVGNGGKIAWGIVPTKNAELLKKIKLSDVKQKFYDGVKNLTDDGINERLVIDSSIITPSCGAGYLGEDTAEKVMDLVLELSKELKKEYKI